MLLLAVNFLCLLKSDAFADKPFYTVQVLTTKNKEDAEKAFSKIETYKDSRIDYADGFYKVRIGLFKSIDDANRFLKRHREIKKLFSTAYVTLNYYNPKRTIKRGGSFKEETKQKPEKPKFVKIEKEKKSDEKEVNIGEVENVSKAGNASSFQKSDEKSTVANTAFNKEKGPSDFGKVVNKNLKTVLFFTLIGAICAGFAFLSFKNRFKVCEKMKSVYIATLKNLPLKASKKVLEYHYRKSDDFKSLLLMKLKENDVNFILKEAPRYLLKYKDDILVWKIYIETLANLGLYLDAADACDKLAGILKDSRRPEAAVSYRKKAEDYRKKASKNLENQA